MKQECDAKEKKNNTRKALKDANKTVQKKYKKSKRERELRELLLEEQKGGVKRMYKNERQEL